MPPLIPRIALPVVLACILTAAIYSPGLRGGFALDDYTNVVQNPAVAIQDLSWSSLSHAAFSFEAGPSMRPLSMLSFALNAYFTGSDDARAFKITNLCIHLADGLLVFWFLWQLATAYRNRFAPEILEQRFQWFALITGTVWLLHPLNVMPVLYVVQRETALSALFVLLGVNLYVWTRSRQLQGLGRSWPIWFGIPLLTFTAALCKESGTLLPIYTLVVEATIFRFQSREARVDTGLVAFYSLFLIVPGVTGLTWILTAHNGGFLNYTGRDFNLPERLMTEARVVWDYIRWILLPDTRSLGLYHDDIAVSHGLFAPVTTLFAIIGIAGLLTVGVFVRGRLPLVSLGIAWFLGGQLLESTVFPLELAYEHRCYLPDLGLILAVMSLLVPLKADAVLRAVRYAVLVVAIGLCATVTWMRAYDWRDNLGFAAAEARHHPESPYATYMLGQTYANLALMNDPGQYENAVASLQAASAVPNSTVIPDVSLVLVEAQLKGTIDPEVMPRIAAKLSDRKLAASDIQGLSALGDCVDKLNCKVKAADMQAIFHSAIANPYLAQLKDTHANILVIYGNYAVAAEQDLKKGRDLMAQAAALVPREPQYQENLVTMDISMQNAVLAEQDLEGLKRLNYLGHLDVLIGRLQTEIREIKPPPR